MNWEDGVEICLAKGDRDKVGWRRGIREKKMKRIQSSECASWCARQCNISVCSTTTPKSNGTMVEDGLARRENVVWKYSLVVWCVRVKASRAAVRIESTDTRRAFGVLIGRWNVTVWLAKRACRRVGHAFGGSFRSSRLLLPLQPGLRLTTWQTLHTYKHITIACGWQNNYAFKNEFSFNRVPGSIHQHTTATPHPSAKVTNRCLTDPRIFEISLSSPSDQGCSRDLLFV